MEQETKDSIVDVCATVASRAEEFDRILVICEKKEGGLYYNSNEILVKDAVFMTEAFK